jgi:hypothetical protein
MLQWLTNSPNLNPIENVWKMLKNFVNKGSRPKHKVDLVARIHLAWKEFSIETLEVLIASMPHCMMAVLILKVVRLNGRQCFIQFFIVV